MGDPVRVQLVVGGIWGELVDGMDVSDSGL